jgi:hypothetical protein
MVSECVIDHMKEISTIAAASWADIISSVLQMYNDEELLVANERRKKYMDDNRF